LRSSPQERVGVSFGTAPEIQYQDVRQEDLDPENRYIVVWRDKNEENRYSARSLEDAEEYYQRRI